MRPCDAGLYWRLEGAITFLALLAAAVARLWRGRYHKSIILCCEALDPFKPEVTPTYRHQPTSPARVRAEHFAHVGR